MTDNNKDIIKEIKEVTSLFKLERTIYISVITICLLVFLATIIRAAILGEIGPFEITSILGSGGGFSYMCGRLLHMWDKAINLLKMSDFKENTDE